MTKNLMACRILQDAQADLQTVIHSLAKAEPEQLESAQRSLARMPGSLREIVAAARRDSSSPIGSSLKVLKQKLGQAGSLSAIALNSLERQAALAGLGSGGLTPALYFEG